MRILRSLLIKNVYLLAVLTFDFAITFYLWGCCAQIRADKATLEGERTMRKLSEIHASLIRLRLSLLSLLLGATFGGGVYVDPTKLTAPSAFVLETQGHKDA